MNVWGGLSAISGRIRTSADKKEEGEVQVVGPDGMEIENTEDRARIYHWNRIGQYCHGFSRQKVAHQTEQDPSICIHPNLL